MLNFFSQITRIKNKSKAILEDIKRYLGNSTEKVVKYTCTLAETKDGLQNLWDSANHSVVHSRNAELIRKTNDDIMSLKRVSQTQPPQFLLAKKKLYALGNYTFMVFSSIYTPS